MTPFSSVAILEKLALLKIAFCKAPVLSRASSRRTSVMTSTVPAASSAKAAITGPFAIFSVPFRVLFLLCSYPDNPCTSDAKHRSSGMREEIPVVAPKGSACMRHMTEYGRNPGVVLFVLEDQGDRLVLRPYDADHHGAIRGKGVAFESNRAGLRGRHLQNVVIPPGLALEVFAGMNRGVVLGVGDVAVEEGLGGAFIHETARDDDDAVPVGDRHGAGLDDGLAGKIALGGHQRPGAVQGAVVAREGGEREEEGRQDGSGN